MCVYIYIYIYIFIYMCVCVCVRVCVAMSMSVCLSVFWFVCIFVCSLCTYRDMYRVHPLRPTLPAPDAHHAPTQAAQVSNSIYIEKMYVWVGGCISTYASIYLSIYMYMYMYISIYIYLSISGCTRLHATRTKRLRRFHRPTASSHVPS